MSQKVQEGQIKVVVRVRPLIPREKAENAVVYWTCGSQTIRQQHPLTGHVSQPFFFDHVFGMEATTADIYESVGAPIIADFMKGFNGTIFAYGQTSSGKTYTMNGCPDAPGFLRMVVNQIFDTIEESPLSEFVLRVSYMEIYRENVYDLLKNAQVPLKVAENESNEVIVKNLEELNCRHPDEIFSLLRRGEQNRTYGETEMNERSSRSHTIFRIIVESNKASVDEDEVVNVSQLNLVDLAGSEKASQTGAQGDRFKEGCNINRSLSTLALVIKQLSESSPFVNYRDCKLTRILQNSLGGNSLTAIICAVTPAAVTETFSTLQFASLAKKIRNKALVNEVVTDEAQLKRQKKEIAFLQKRIAEMQQQSQAKEVEKAREENDALKEKLKKLQELVICSAHSPLRERPPVTKRTARRHTMAIPCLDRVVIQPAKLEFKTGDHQAPFAVKCDNLNSASPLLPKRVENLRNFTPVKNGPGGDSTPNFHTPRQELRETNLRLRTENLKLSLNQEYLSERLRELEIERKNEEELAEEAVSLEARVAELQNEKNDAVKSIKAQIVTFLQHSDLDKENIPVGFQHVMNRLRKFLDSDTSDLENPGVSSLNASMDLLSVCEPPQKLSTPLKPVSPSFSKKMSQLLSEREELIQITEALEKMLKAETQKAQTLEQGNSRLVSRLQALEESHKFLEEHMIKLENDKKAMRDCLDKERNQVSSKHLQSFQEMFTQASQMITREEITINSKLSKLEEDFSACEQKTRAFCEQKNLTLSLEDKIKALQSDLEESTRREQLWKRTCGDIFLQSQKMAEDFESRLAKEEERVTNLTQNISGKSSSIRKLVQERSLAQDTAESLKSRNENLLADVDSLKCNNEILLADIESLRRNNEMLLADMGNQKSCDGRLLADVENLKSKNEILIAEVESMKSNNEMLLADVESRKNENQMLLEDMKSLKSNNQMLLADIESGKNENQTLFEDMESLKRSNEMLLADLESRKNNNESLLADLESRKNENELLLADVESLKNNNEILLEDVKSLKSNNEMLLADLESLKSSNQMLLADAEIRTNDNELLLADVENLKSSNEVLLADVESQKNDNQMLLEDLKSLQSKNEVLLADVENLNISNEMLLATVEARKNDNEVLLANAEILKSKNEMLIADVKSLKERLESEKEQNIVVKEALPVFADSSSAKEILGESTLNYSESHVLLETQTKEPAQQADGNDGYFTPEEEEDVNFDQVLEEPSKDPLHISKASAFLLGNTLAAGEVSFLSIAESTRFEAKTATERINMEEELAGKLRTVSEQLEKAIEEKRGLEDALDDAEERCESYFKEIQTLRVHLLASNDGGLAPVESNTAGVQTSVLETPLKKQDASFNRRRSCIAALNDTISALNKTAAVAGIPGVSVLDLEENLAFTEVIASMKNELLELQSRLEKDVELREEMEMLRNQLAVKTVEVQAVIRGNLEVTVKPDETTKLFEYDTVRETESAEVVWRMQEDVTGAWFGDHVMARFASQLATLKAHVEDAFNKQRDAEFDRLTNIISKENAKLEASANSYLKQVGEEKEDLVKALGAAEAKNSALVAKFEEERRELALKTKTEIEQFLPKIKSCYETEIRELLEQEWAVKLAASEKKIIALQQAIDSSNNELSSLHSMDQTAVKNLQAELASLQEHLEITNKSLKEAEEKCLLLTNDKSHYRESLATAESIRTQLETDLLSANEAREKTENRLAEIEHLLKNERDLVEKLLAKLDQSEAKISAAEWRESEIKQQYKTLKDEILAEREQNEVVRKEMQIHFAEKSAELESLRQEAEARKAELLVRREEDQEACAVMLSQTVAARTEEVSRLTELLIKQKKESTDEIAALETKNAHLKERCASLETQGVELDEIQKRLELSLIQLQHKIEELTDSNVQYKTSLAASETKFEALKTDLFQLELRLAESTRLAQEIQLNLDEEVTRNQDLQALLSSREDQMASLELKVEAACSEEVNLRQQLEEKTEEISIMKNLVESTFRARGELDEELSQLQAIYSDLQARFEAREEMLALKEQETAELKNQIMELQQNIDKLVEDLRKSESLKEEAMSKEAAVLKASVKDIMALKEEKRLLVGSLEEKQMQLDGAIQALAEQDSEIGVLKAAVEDQIEIAEKATELAKRFEQERESLIVELRQKEQRVKELDAECDELDNDLQKANEVRKVLAISETALQKTVKEFELDKKALENTVVDLKAEIARLEARVKELDEECDRIDNDLQAANEDRKQKALELAGLKCHAEERLKEPERLKDLEQKLENFRAENRSLYRKISTLQAANERQGISAGGGRAEWKALQDENERLRMELVKKNRNLRSAETELENVRAGRVSGVTSSAGGYNLRSRRED